MFTVGFFELTQTGGDVTLEISIGAKVSIIEKVGNSIESQFDYEWNELDFNDWKEFAIYQEFYSPKDM